MRGTISFPSNHGEDVCGICHGDGTSCLDCDNVVNGNKMVDFCGECLDPSDSSFNKGYTWNNWMKQNNRLHLYNWMKQNNRLHLYNWMHECSLVINKS